MKFFIGLHHPSTAWAFKSAMISAMALRDRQSEFRVNEWILDSGAFSQISKYGKFIISTNEYLKLIERFSTCGTLVAAVTQDWMCEPWIVEKTGQSVEKHQELTLQSYIGLSLRSEVPILPVLQGYEPQDYVRHLAMYDDWLAPGQLVGVGSVCKRNGNPDAIEDVLLAIKAERPDILLHGFGLKIQALERATVRSLLESCDSMAWSLANRYEMGNGHDPREALRYCAKVQSIIKEPTFIQQQLYDWWST